MPSTSGVVHGVVDVPTEDEPSTSGLVCYEEVDADVENEEHLPDLQVEREELVKELPLPTSRRIVDLAHVVEKIRLVERHSMECNHGGSLVHVKTVQVGMVSILHYTCCKPECPVKYQVQTANPESIHLDSALATTSIGIGYRQMEELLAILQSPYISEANYEKYEQGCGNLLKKSEQDSTKSAIEEEKNMARLADDVDEKGNLCITIIVDGGWSKRSYGHSYNAKSGAAVIIGARTKKVLFSGTRNKYCTVCVLSQNKGEQPKYHDCKSNWSGSSTAMEADIIVEGINWLQEQHGLYCTRVVGDGDSSVMSKIREKISYGASVQKIECANHAVKNFRKKLEATAANTKAFRGKDGVKARRLLKAKTGRLAAEARGVIVRNAISDPKLITSAAITKLRIELDNVPFHVLGQHDNCPAESVCHQIPHENSVPFLKTVEHFFENVEEATNRLSSYSSSLIHNVTSNSAECFMSMKAKATGAKRVDFSKGHGYSRRVKVASLSFNKPGQAWHRDVHKTHYNKSPKSPMKKLIKKRGRKLERDRKSQLNQRLLFQDDHSNSPTELVQRKSKPKRTTAECPGLDYGSCDAEPQHLKTLCDNFYQAKVSVTDEKRKKIEESTRNQGNGSPQEVALWKTERSLRVSASNAKKVFSRRETTLSATLVRNLIYPTDFSTAATSHGHVGERKAKIQYAKEYRVTVSDCGLYVDKCNPFLCASPDGIVHTENETYLLEVKSPYNARLCSSIDAAMEVYKSRFPLRKNDEGKYFLPEDHEFFFQIQVQLQCANLNRCDYVVYIVEDMEVVPIYRNKDFMAKILPKLKQFYMECILPELADSRMKRGLPLREPKRIMEAINAANCKKKA